MRCPRIQVVSSSGSRGTGGRSACPGAPIDDRHDQQGVGKTSGPCAVRIFVAGATGVIGRRVVGQLITRGHDVTGVARTPEAERLLGSLAAASVSVSLSEPSALRGALAGQEAVVNLATRIPAVSKAAMPKAWRENDRLRTEGVRSLAGAARAAGVTRFIQESVVFAYADGGESWVDEDCRWCTRR